mmetsp:Transcript_20322/g.43994  ORF Transcript_20322/g.43994 Transcript_20322/m.43994 type:complete len:125 (-) Transcript_20322:171-545(-)
MYPQVTDFANFRLFSKPGEDLPARLAGNVSHFKGNYAVLFVIFFSYSILANPFLLLSIVILAAAWIGESSLNDRTISIFGRSIHGHERKLALAAVTAITLLFSSAGSTLFWAIGITTLGEHHEF